MQIRRLRSNLAAETRYRGARRRYSSSSAGLRKRKRSLFIKDFQIRILYTSIFFFPTAVYGREKFSCANSKRIYVYISRWPLKHKLLRGIKIVSVGIVKV